MLEIWKSLHLKREEEKKREGGESRGDGGTGEGRKEEQEAGESGGERGNGNRLP